MQKPRIQQKNKSNTTDPNMVRSYYGGVENPYEAIKVIEAWDLGFNLGNTAKYISRCGKKGDEIEDLKKALFYLSREIDNRVNRNFE